MLQAWFLDDGSKIGSPGEVIKAWNILAEHGPSIGLHLNPTKCEWIVIKGEAPCPIEGVGSVKGNNFDILGCPIGSHDYCNSYILKSFKESQPYLDSIANLQHAQIATLLLRHCFSFCKAVYLHPT